MPIFLHLIYDAASCVNLSQLVGALTSGYSSVCTGSSPLLLHLFYDAASCVNLGQLAGALMGGYSSAVHEPLIYYYI
jgi:hypothetical protein